jgi:predicted dehydrogenase
MFIDSLEKNEQPPLSGEEALKAMRAIIASIESAEMHQTVVVKQY